MNTDILHCVLLVVMYIALVALIIALSFVPAWLLQYLVFFFFEKKISIWITWLCWFFLFACFFRGRRG